jgi:hypothetical protein
MRLTAVAIGAVRVGMTSGSLDVGKIAGVGALGSVIVRDAGCGVRVGTMGSGVDVGVAVAGEQAASASSKGRMRPANPAERRPNLPGAEWSMRHPLTGKSGACWKPPLFMTPIKYRDAKR